MFEYFFDLTLNELEARLDPAAFLRVSRTALLSLTAIMSIRPTAQSTGEAVLKGCRTFAVSRRRWPALVRALAGAATPR